ncbi:MAG: hypothetical protein AAF651_02005 [Cyanobacteria bacterium P01_C01_bin.73]
MPNAALTVASSSNRLDGFSTQDRGLSLNRSEHTAQDIQAAQQTIYDFLLHSVKTLPSEEVLAEFKQLFIHHTDTVSSETLPAIYIILFANREDEFRNTLKRSCYILINNWEIKREYQAIQSLIDVFADPLITRKTYSHTLKRLRTWLNRFINGDDFEAIRLFAARLTEAKTEEGPWTNRYAPYLLVSQYTDMQNPMEQREAARNLSKRLKTKFKYDLAMYTAHSAGSAALPENRRYKNPTKLGEEALRLVKMIVAKRGKFSYKNLARIFLQQTKDLPYWKFKRSLIAYLIFSVDQKQVARGLKGQLLDCLSKAYINENNDICSPSLILKTANRAIDALTTEDKSRPSELFTLLLSQGTPLTLAIVLLKIILISPKSMVYLEARLADLLRYYEQFPRAQCNWIINFLEIFGVTFAIYAQNVEYNLVDVNGQTHNSESDQARKGLSVPDIEACRIFSQMVHHPYAPSHDAP